MPIFRMTSISKSQLPIPVTEAKATLMLSIIFNPISFAVLAHQFHFSVNHNPNQIYLLKIHFAFFTHILSYDRH